MGIITKISRFGYSKTIQSYFPAALLLLFLTYVLYSKRQNNQRNVEFVITSRDEIKPKEFHKLSQEVTSKLTTKENRKETFHQSQTYRTNSLQCPINWSPLPTKIIGSVKPLIDVDRNKYLLPILINGPNNQLVGFRKTIYIAIKLNRTIVIPKFFKHRLNDPSGDFIDASHRMNFDLLATFVRTVTLEQFAESCHGNIDAVLRVREMTSSMYKGLERQFDMNIVGGISHNLEVLPKELNVKHGKDFMIFNSSASIIRNLYQTEKSCAIHPFEFSNLQIPSKNPKSEQPTNMADLSDVDLYSEIIRFTQPPNHVIEMAENFIADVIGESPYLSVHWRFDKDDWMRRCLAKTPWGTQERREMCDVILKFTPKEIAEAIHNKANQVANINDVYLASPPSDGVVIDDVIRILQTEHNMRVFTSTDLRQHWRKFYSSCDWLWKDENDILSTTEMEICRRGAVFLRSPSSTWSKNVRLGRDEETMPFASNDGVILALVKEVHTNKKPS